MGRIKKSEIDKDHDCYHEEEIILLKDHVKDIGHDTKKLLESIFGNGKVGLKERMALTEQNVKRVLWLQAFMTTMIFAASLKLLLGG